MESLGKRTDAVAGRASFLFERRGKRCWGDSLLKATPHMQRVRRLSQREDAKHAPEVSREVVESFARSSVAASGPEGSLTPGRARRRDLATFRAASASSRVGDRKRGAGSDASILRLEARARTPSRVTFVDSQVTDEHTSREVRFVRPQHSVARSRDSRERRTTRRGARGGSANAPAPRTTRTRPACRARRESTAGSPRSRDAARRLGDGVLGDDSLRGS